MFPCRADYLITLEIQGLCASGRLALLPFGIVVTPSSDTRVGSVLPNLLGIHRILHLFTLWHDYTPEPSELMSPSMPCIAASREFFISWALQFVICKKFVTFFLQKLSISVSFYISLCSSDYIFIFFRCSTCSLYGFRTKSVAEIQNLKLMSKLVPLLLYIFLLIQADKL